MIDISIGKNFLALWKCTMLIMVLVALVYKVAKTH